MSQVAKWAGNLILAGIILVVLFVFLAPRFMDYEFLTVRSGSMAPAIEVGAVIMVQPVRPYVVQPGDIITYRSADDPKSFVTHRVVEVIPGERELSFLTKGDANEDPDTTPIPASRLVGQVGLSVPGLGYLTQYIRTPLGFAFFIVVPAAILIAIQIKDIVAALRPSRQKETK